MSLTTPQPNLTPPKTLTSSANPYALWPTPILAIPTEAAHFAVLLAYGAGASLRALFKYEVVHALLYVLVEMTSAVAGTSPEPLVSALAQALRALDTAFADAVGPA